jgi:protein involved in polysaccharide export with SLBB domain
MNTETNLRIGRVAMGVRHFREKTRRLLLFAVYALLTSVFVFNAHAAPPEPSTGLVGQPPVPSVPPTPPQKPPPVPPVDQHYRIAPGDELSIQFVFEPGYNTIAVVRPDGAIDLPRIGTVTVSGMTVTELTDYLKKQYVQDVGILRHTDLAVNINKGFANQQVFVGGEVVRPGVQPLTPSLTTLQAILVAEGFKDTANADKVVVLRRGDYGQPQYLTVAIGDVMNNGEHNARGSQGASRCRCWRA